ncbi:MAG: hypothetical protein U9P71_03930 [Campylobacterota bacterium]|nr:hypothetical protein [Campylobacterota bacterium]
MRILLLSILSALLLSASDTNHQVKILEKIVSEISINKQVKIWSDDKEILYALKNSKKFKTVTECYRASFIILKEKKNLSKVCDSVHIFVLNYKLLSDIPQSFGALFWKKGRPNIVIIEPRIQRQNIQITTNLKPYLEEKVW